MQRAGKYTASADSKLTQIRQNKNMSVAQGSKSRRPKRLQALKANVTSVATNVEKGKSVIYGRYGAIASMVWWKLM